MTRQSAMVGPSNGGGESDQPRIGALSTSRVTPIERAKDEREFLHYFRCLVEGLRQELERRSNDLAAQTDAVGAWHSRASRFCHLLDCHSEIELCGEHLSEVMGHYAELAVEKGSILNAVAAVAREYESMEAFWADVEAEPRGESHYTYWDTFEHGRRRQLESLFARTYGSEDALLLNSGMSGIAVICQMLNLRPGDTIVTGERSYFETGDFLHRYFSERGIRIQRVPVADAQKVIAVLKQSNPRLVLVETATNAPSVDVPEDIATWFDAAPEAIFLIDNSVQSHLTRWFTSPACVPARTLVLESGVKYATHHCMAGIIYGCREALEPARSYARLAGHQLQEKAFNFISEAEVEHLAEKLDRHSRNARAFHEALEPYRHLFSYTRLLDSTSGREAADTLFGNGVGSLIFLALAPDDTATAQDLNLAHRSLLDEWRRIAKEGGLAVEIRCGFGWNQTTARVYESHLLNQPGAPTYLRISVGIEPDRVIRTLAQCLGKAAETSKPKT